MQPTSEAQHGAAAPSRAGYVNFGSFMVDRPVEELIVDESWQAPPNPCAAATTAPAPATATDFGAPFRCHFLIDFARWTFVNHGGFGAAARPAHQEAAAWRERCEAQPLAFLDRELFPQLVRVLRELGAFVNARPQDLALLPNATTGLSTVMASFRGRLGPGDAVLYLDVGYGSVKKMVQVLAEATGAEAVQAELRFPLSTPEDIVDQVANALPPHARVAVFDAVTSNTALLLPITQLVSLCHSRGVEVVIDGAHALGMLPLDLEALGADYFVSNCHKWLCAPRGSAFLWVQPQHKQHVRPLIVSHGWGSGFTSDFIWDGCRDYASLLAISAALRFWEGVGLEGARQYQQELLQQAVQLLTSAWGSSTLVPLEMHAPCMALVALPAGAVPAGQQATSADAKYIQDALHLQHSVECPIKCIGGALYTRVSCHVYNCLADYATLAEAMHSVVAAAAASAQRDGS